MPHVIRVTLTTSPEQQARLEALQGAFVQACNSLMPLVVETKVWNRVTLHHLAYRQLREKFPAIGSQMACNVIYSVSRASRIVYQHPQSPFNLGRLGTKPLPLITFGPNSPVYFDRHTLSLRPGAISMFTLDGRMQFDVALTPEDELRFRNEKIREIVLGRVEDGRYQLSFHFAGELEEAAPAFPQPGAALPANLQVESNP